MTDLVRHVNEGVRVSVDVSAVTFLNFELYERLYISGSITNNSSEITFIEDASDKKYITGFAINVVNLDKKKVKNAIKLGNRTVNYLSAMTGVAVRSKRPKIERQIGDTSPPQTKGTLQQLPNFDLDASKVTSLLSGKPSRNKKIVNYQSGMAAINDNDLEKAVQRFHQVIEKSGLNDAKKYAALRTACSHHRIDVDGTAKAIRSLGIKCTRGKPVDFTDPDNWQQLYNHAHALKGLADIHMRKILP